MFTLLFSLFQGCSVEEAPPKPAWAAQDHWEQWTQCTNTDCRSEIINAVFRADDPIAATWINSIEQPEERYLQVEKLQTKYPGRIQLVCTKLKDAELKKRCLTSSARPHLYAQGNVRPPKSLPKRTAAGPEASLILLPLVPNSPLRNVQPHTDQCTGQVDARSCLHDKAMEMVDRGDSLEVARYCQAIPSSEKRWRWECHFKAAESFLARDLRNYPIAAEHCLVANEYSGRCVTVLNKTLAKSSPPADKNDWTQSLELAEQIKEVWKPYGKEVTSHILGSFWGFSLLHSYRIAKTITGDPFDHLPLEVVPHIHAAAAFEVLSRKSPSTDLSELVEELEKSLESRDTDSLTAIIRYSHPTIPDFWMEDEAQDVDVIAINYLGKSRRTYSDDKAEDLSICILEAAARVDGWQPLIKEHKKSSVPSIKWTARRLLNNLRRER